MTKTEYKAICKANVKTAKEAFRQACKAYNPVEYYQALADFMTTNCKTRAMTAKEISDAMGGIITPQETGAMLTAWANRKYTYEFFPMDGKIRIDLGKVSETFVSETTGRKMTLNKSIKVYSMK